MKKLEEDITQLVKNLQIDEQQAQEIITDLQAGDKLLNSQSEPDPPAELLDQIEITIKTHLSHRPARRVYIWSMRFASAAAIIIIFVTLITLWTGPGSVPVSTPLSSPKLVDIYDDDSALWEVALTQEMDGEEEIDDLVIIEVSLMWDEIEEPLDDLFGKENTYENVT
ncbi:MAG: hypothetical protein JW860_12835 [Sedimentisphaerales bacterium]|nr:hypothetical protein [Sedimentisphaerales bacterium]